MFYLLGLLEPILAFVLIKCKHMTFPGLVGEPPQTEHMEPAVVKEEEEEEQVQVWWPCSQVAWPCSGLKQDCGSQPETEVRPQQGER